MIIKLSEIETYIDKIRQENSSVVLVGGCFDILHFGHIKFLEKVKDKNNYVIILLESDTRVKKLKGENRPIFLQHERAYALSSLKYVDLVILLPDKMEDSDYAKIMDTIKPNIIGITENDSNIKKKEEHAKLIGAVIKTISHIDTYSTSTLAKIIGIE